MPRKKATANFKLDPKNARMHGDASKRIIKQILEENGAARSIVVDNEDYVVAGNGVYEQAKDLGIPTRIIESDGSELIVVKRTDLSYDDEKRRRVAIADNAAHEFSEWDFSEDGITKEEADHYGIDFVYEDDAEFLGQETNTAVDYDYPMEDMHISHIRMVNLYLTTETQPVFKQMEEKLRPHLETDNVTDTIYAALSWLIKHFKVKIEDQE